MTVFTRIALALLFVAGNCEAFAMTTLKQVQVSNSSQIDLLFDGKVNKSQIQTEFFNDIIQISMIDVTVYPAKISSVNGGVLRKVFAYQYAPRLVRCRLTVSGKAENYKERIQVSSSGKMLTIKVSDSTPVPMGDSVPGPAAAGSSTVSPAGSSAGSTGALKDAPAEKIDRISVQGAAPVRNSANEAEGNQERRPDSHQDSAEEKALLEHVMSAPLQKTPDSGKKSDKAEKGENSSKKEKKPELKKPAPLPSLRGVLMKLGLVLGIFGVFAVLLKKVAGARGNRVAAKGAAAMLGAQWGSLGGVLGRFAKSGIGKLGQKEKMIEVLSTHHLGPKQSIAVVRVCGQKMVLGIANDSISLISQISGDEFDLDGPDGEALTGSVADFLRGGKDALPKPTVKNSGNFASYLSESQQSGENRGPAMTYSRTPEPASFTRGMGEESSNSASVRARIRSRLEGLKQL
jgi:flagellar biogenesis protein FliO